MIEFQYTFKKHSLVGGCQLRERIQDGPSIRRERIQDGPYIRRERIQDGPYIRREGIQDGPYIRLLPLKFP